MGSATSLDCAYIVLSRPALARIVEPGVFAINHDLKILYKVCLHDYPVLLMLFAVYTHHLVALPVGRSTGRVLSYVRVAMPLKPRIMHLAKPLRSLRGLAALHCAGGLGLLRKASGPNDVRAPGALEAAVMGLAEALGLNRFIAQFTRLHVYSEPVGQCGGKG